ncbi:MAG: DUF3634 family protein [Myxococcales bacterium]|nr:DUF3634 family protein [Myxococcales bacterium]
MIPVALFAWLLFAVARSRLLFALTIRAGKITKVKGRIPPVVVGELEDVFRGTDSAGTLTGSTEQGRVRTDFSGRVRPEVLQRARNVVGLYSLSRYQGQTPR